MPRMTHAEYLSFLSRSKRVNRQPLDYCPSLQDSEQREVGKGGVQDEIDQWLKSLGNRCFYIRSRTDKPSTSQVGNADFNGWLRLEGWDEPMPFSVEIKRKGQKPTLAQLSRLKQAECAGAITGIAHSLLEFKKILGMT